MSNPIGDLLKQFHKEIIVIGVFSFLANILMLTPTIYLLQVFDRVMISQSGLTLIAISFICILLFVVMSFSDWCRSRLLVVSGLRFDQLLNSKVFFASFKAALNRGLPNPGEGLMDLVNLRQFLTGSNIFAFFDLPWSPIYIVVSWMLHPTLGLISVAFVILLSFFVILSQWVFRHEHQAHIDANNIAVAFLQTKVKNIEVIYSMGMMNNLFFRWRALYSDQMDCASSIQSHQQSTQSILKFLQYTQQSLLLCAGAVLVIRGDLTVGSMIAVSVLGTRALQPIQALVGSWRSIMAAKISYDRLNQLLINYPDMSAMVLPQAIQGRLDCDNLVAFNIDKTRFILNKINLTLLPGESLAIIGPSGSGKSTLIRCLLGIWPTIEGDVKLDHVSIKNLDREVLGPAIGFLPQEIELFEGSVAENIARFGQLDSTKVIEAAQIAGIHDMILRFPNGYDSPIGVAGSLLSRGQMQRLAFARAIFGNPKLLVLDEPNSNLDDLGEAALLKALLNLKKQGTTIVIVSHRLGILNIADKIMILERGEVSALGNREEILQQRQAAKASALS